MVPSPFLLVGLDLVSLLLEVVVAAFFLQTWRRTGNATHLLFAIGFFLLALGTGAVSSSALDLLRNVETWDGLRMGGQTGGALVLFFSYASMRRGGHANILRVAAATIAFAASLMVILYVFVPPFLEVPSLESMAVVADAVQFLAYAGCVAFASITYRRVPQPEYLLVPGAFMLLALSKYTWVLIDLSHAINLVGFVYVWRILALGLLLGALLLPRRPRPEASREPA
ncbi:MAG TPA: hypothetical protein VNZ52_02755 [Candidatus Thermoplasmatota archaeon]|nr:hypothetical protein [Candidatus Thermoplasmatota archaeon]